MLQQSEIKRKLVRIEHEIDEVAKRCKADEKLPQKLKECVTEWKQQTDKVMSEFDSTDSKQIVESVNELEQIGHRAEMALQEATDADAKMCDSLMHAQGELFKLKKKLH